jgi:hypothetical protein
LGLPDPADASGVDPRSRIVNLPDDTPTGDETMRMTLIAAAITAGLGLPAAAQTPSVDPAGALSAAEMRELLQAVKATAKATREGVDYARTTPDLLFQILTKLDKLENKLDKIENLLQAQRSRQGAR